MNDTQKIASVLHVVADYAQDILDEKVYNQFVDGINTVLKTIQAAPFTWTAGTTKARGKDAGAGYSAQ